MAASAGALARRALGGAPLQQLQLQLQQWNAWHEVACRQLQQHAGQNLRGPRAYSTGVSDGSSSSDGSSASASSASSSSSSSSVVTPPPQRAMPMGYSTSALAGGASEQQEEPQQHEQQQEQQQPLQQQPLEQLRIQLRQEQQHAEAEQVVDAYSLSRSLVGSGPAGAREQAAPAAAAAAAQARLTAADKAALEKLVGILTKDGKKSRARRVLLDAMHIIKQQLAKGRPNGA